MSAAQEHPSSAQLNSTKEVKLKRTTEVCREA
jgi:hypothetical protein